MTSRTLRLAAPALLAVALAGCDARTHGPFEHDDAAPVAPDELVVDLVDGTSLEAFRARFGLAAEATRWNSPNVADEAIAVVRVPRAEQAALLARLRADAMVEHAEPSYLVSIGPSELFTLGAGDVLPEDDQPPPLAGFPNDPYYPKQWNMEMVHARDAWRYASGEGVVVAVLDTGVGYEGTKRGPAAPDLGATGFVKGYDFVNDDDDPGDDHGHGTHCAGTVAQSTNNGRGVIGLAHRARIMPLKVLSAGGWGTTVDIADAIRYAADNGAHVLSLSLGGGGHSKVLADAVKYARDKGCLVVCAAGNGGRAKVEYPAAYPGATAVSSVGPKGKLAFYSSHGKETFIAAPGGDKSQGPEAGVLQNTVDPRQRKTIYAFWQGTSMATPHVAGAAALLYSCGVTDPDAIEDILRATARPGADASGGWTQKYGWGVLDAGAAVRRAMFLPGSVALGLSALLVLLASRRLERRDAALPLVALGALAASSGLFFLRPLGLGEVPVIGPFITRGIAVWDLPLFGPSWHWTPLFASALIPGFVGLVTVKAPRFIRSLAVGLMLGWAARLITGVILPWADVRLIPGHGALDSIWLAGNAVALLAFTAVVVRLARGKASSSVIV
ncbi:MAG: S8 family peptidase [Planctomycetes bacterium]|nr:S8 family peptidase [Planctomycetota bacterium]